VQFLSLILFLPTFFIMGMLFVLFPRETAGGRRRVFDLAALTLSLALSIGAMLWGYRHSMPDAGPIWKQVLAALMAYGAFIFTGTIALPLRARLFRRA
jgi:hypothetical protein